MGLAALGFLAMARWTDPSLDHPTSSVVLVVTGLGFGLATAPVNQALLAATDPRVHGVAAALLVVARTVGMLVGLSALTAVGLHAFYAEQRRIGSPFVLCPMTPLDCPRYEHELHSALLSELHVVFWGAGVCAALSALCAVALLAPTAGEQAVAKTSA
jgi:hypothetical protein